MAKYFKKMYLNSFVINNIKSVCSVLSENILYEAIEFDNGYEADLCFNSIQLDNESTMQFYFKLYDESNCLIDDGNVIYYSPLGKYYLEDDYDNTYVIEVAGKPMANINKVDVILSKNKIKTLNKYGDRLSYFNVTLKYKNDDDSIIISKLITGDREKIYNIITDINHIKHSFFPSSGDDKNLYQKWYIIDSKMQYCDIHVIDIKKG